MLQYTILFGYFSFWCVVFLYSHMYICECEFICERICMSLPNRWIFAVPRRLDLYLQMHSCMSVSLCDKQQERVTRCCTVINITLTREALCVQRPLNTLQGQTVRRNPVLLTVACLCPCDTLTHTHTLNHLGLNQQLKCDKGHSCHVPTCQQKSYSNI